MKDSNLELRNRNKGEELKSMSKTILITGASSGFGRDTAETLFRAGHTVYASMRGTQGKNREAAEALRKLGIKTVELDVSDDASVEAGVKKVLVEAGRIDVLVNNAGIMSAGVTEAFTAEQAKVVFDGGAGLVAPFEWVVASNPIAMVTRKMMTVMYIYMTLVMYNVKWIRK